MPTIVTPPGIDPRRKISEGDNGNGRRPPVDKRTGGGGDGDGDNWNDRPAGSRGPRERLKQYRIGIGSILAADFMLFVALMIAYFATRANGHINAYGEYVHEWHPTIIPTILRLNTVIILLSSVTAEIARHGMFREKDVMEEWIGLGKPTSRRATLWLGITLALGIMFLAGQSVAWQQLAAQHVFYASNPSSKFFYIITATHAAHLFVGIAALITALTGLRISRQFASRQILVDTTVWYWHAMGALWILLYALLEFFQ